MNKTQLTILIEEIDKRIAHYENYDSSKNIVSELKGVRGVAIALLPKEREDMEDMAEYGHAEHEKWTINAESIFDTNFTQYKTNSNG